MAGYKDAEIEAAVSRYVQTTLRIERDALGPVDVGSKFNEVLQLISSTLVYDPNAIFYVIFLATNKLNAAVELTLEYVDDIGEAIDEMGHHTEDVTRTTLLGDAAAALLTVDQILTDKSAISSRAFTRYQQAVDDFTEVSLEPNIKQSGQVVRPPQLARSESQTAINSLSTAYPDILETLAQIRLMLSEFNSLNLGVLSIQNSVQKVRDDLRTLQAQFESSSTTRDDKIAMCRNAYLSIAAGKSVLNNFTTVSDPSDARLTSSSIVVGRPETPLGDGELVPATVVGANSAPWEISATADQLKITADDGAEQTYTFTTPDQPSVICFVDETYDIDLGVSDQLEIDGLSVTLTAGVGRTATQIADDINSWATGGSYPYSASVETLDTLNYVKITKDTPGATEIRMTAEDLGDRDIILATYEVLGFYEGQSDSSDGLSAAEAVAEINSVGELTASVQRTLYEGGDADGHIETTTVLRLPLNTLSSTDHVGDMLLVRSGINAGYRRISGVVRASYDDIVVEAAEPFKVTGLDESWLVLSEKLKLTSGAADLTTAVEIGSASLNSVMGFTAGTTVGATTGFRVAESSADVDFTQSDVVAGDIVRIGSTDYEVVELSANSQLELDPPLATNAIIPSFQILSAAAVAYGELVSALAEWDDLLAASDFQEDILELERVMNPLIANKNPSIAQLQDARNTLQSLRDLLSNASPDGLAEILQAFQVRIVPRIDAALKMLKERGMDRAYDLLMDGKIEEFFGMDKDDASSSAYMLKSMRDVVQSDLPLSKLDEDADDIIHDDLVVGTDPDYDYSDADADENVKLLGEVPDFDNAEDADWTSKVRY